MSSYPSDTAVLAMAEQMKGHSIKRMALALSVGAPWLRRRLAALGVAPATKRKTKLSAHTKEQLQQECAKHFTLGQAAKALGVSENTLRFTLVQHGVDPMEAVTNRRMNRPSPMRDAIIKVLRENGPMHAEEIYEHVSALGVTNTTGRASVSVCIKLERKHTGTEVFRVSDWKRLECERGVGGPVWDLGPGEDVPRPKMAPLSKRRRKSQKEYRERHRVVIRARHRKSPISPFGGLLAMARG